jgi:hypothetical protein
MNANPPEMTDAEKAFFERAADYFERGLSFDDAMRAVLARDLELFAAAMAKTLEGEAIRKGLAAQVYHAIKKREAKWPVRITRASADAVADALNRVIDEIRAAPSECLISQFHDANTLLRLETFRAYLRSGKRISLDVEAGQ